MAVTVILASSLTFGGQPSELPLAWWAVYLMAAITFFSRFTLFLGIKHLGGLQTALLGLSEIFVTILLSSLWLGERLSLLQWTGAGLLGLSLLLVGIDRAPQQKRVLKGWLSWLNPAKIPAADLNWPGQP
jgi:drug/metabolite transporter (DMT)-like permease